jgi:hypothetical protein
MSVSRFCDEGKQRLKIRSVLKSYTFWDITRCSEAKVKNVSEEYIAFIFRVKIKESKKPT